MENQNAKEVLSECCNTQRNLYLGRGNSINSLKKMDSLFTSGSSDASAANVCTSPVISKNLGSTLINNHPNVMNDRDDLTTPRRKSEENTNVEIANNKVTPSRGFSDSTAVDCKIMPDFFTSQNKGKDYGRQGWFGKYHQAAGILKNSMFIAYHCHATELGFQ